MSEDKKCYLCNRPVARSPFMNLYTPTKHVDIDGATVMVHIHCWNKREAGLRRVREWNSWANGKSK